MVEDEGTPAPNLPLVMRSVFLHPAPCKTLHVTSSCSLFKSGFFRTLRTGAFFSSCECELRVKVGSSCEGRGYAVSEGRDNSSSPRIDWLRYAVSERTALVDLPGTFRENSSSRPTSF